MSARKLGRIAGLVFVLAVVFGGVAVASQADQGDTVAVQMSPDDSIEWD